MITADEMQATLHSLGLKVRVESVESRPPLYRYMLELGPKVRLSKLEAMAEDIALAAKPIAPPVIRPDFATGRVMLEMMYDQHPVVHFSDIYGTPDGMKLPITLGARNVTEPFIVDLTTIPHMIVAGTTGSGKSMLLHCITQSLINQKSSVGVKLVLIDPKLVEFSRYERNSALMFDKVVNSIDDTKDVLAEISSEMEKRFQAFKKRGVRDIEEYRSTAKKISYIPVIIDELADLIRDKSVEKIICSIAQKGRAAGIHIIAATQHPSAKVITGEIRANFPGRIACKVASPVHSRVVIDRSGAENLLGQGDAIYHDASGEYHRFKGALVDLEAYSAQAKKERGSFMMALSPFFRRK